MKKRKPHACGDFDSIQQSDLALIHKKCHCVDTLSPTKDESDSQVAIEWAIAQKYETIFLLGAMGKRRDHEYVNTQLMKRYHNKIIMMDDFNKMTVLSSGEYTLEKEDYHYISFFPLEETRFTVSGVQYPITDVVWDTERLLGLSNEILEKKALLAIKKGKLLCIWSKDK